MKTDLVPVAVTSTDRDLTAWQLSFDPIYEGEFDDSEIEPNAIKGLWCSVIREQWRLAFNERKNDSKVDVFYARKWFGTAAFQDVCDFAGFCPRMVFDLFCKHARRAGWGADNGL